MVGGVAGQSGGRAGAGRGGADRGGAGRGGAGRAAGGSGVQVPNTKKLKAAGVRLVLGNDAAGDSNRWLGPMTLMELENFVAAGFTPAETIVAATRQAAEVLRIDLDNISNVRKINKVYLRGQEVDRAGLRARWQAHWSKTSRATATQ